MSAISGYTGSMIDDNGNYYVHLYPQHIGQADGAGDSIEVFLKSLQQVKRDALNSVKQEYKTLFKNSISKGGQKLLAEIYQNDDVLTNVQNLIKGRLQKDLNINKMAALMSIERSVMPVEKDLDSIAKKIFNDSKHRMENFDKLITALVEAVKLVESKTEGPLLSARLTDMKYNKKGEVDLSDLGERILSELSKFKATQANFSAFQIQQMDLIVRTLNVLGLNLKEGQTRSGKSLTETNLQRVVDAIFNTGIAESMAGMIKGKALSTIAENFNIKLTGSTSVKVQFSKELQELMELSSAAKSGKADVKYNNVSMGISLDNKKYYGNILIDLGISNKFYRTKYFPNVPGSNARTYSAGSAGSLWQGLMATFLGSQRAFYYSINIIVHYPGDHEYLSQLRKIIALRQLIRGFATRGGNADFAQFLLINGQIISVWDIIMHAAKTMEYGSKYVAAKVNISNEEGMKKAGTGWKEELQDRILTVNNAIRKAKLEMTINLRNLAKSIE